MTGRALGVVLVCISASAFGTYSYFALMATRGQVGPISLLCFRFGIASLILAGIAAITRQRLPNIRRLAPMLLLGGLYVGQSFTYLQCLLASDPITASLLLYLYPAFVTVGSVFFLHERLTRIKAFALVSAFAGSLLIIGPVEALPVKAIGYGLATSVFYAAYVVIGKRVLGNAPPVMTTLVILSTATAAYLVMGAFAGLRVPAGAEAWGGVFGLAIVGTVIAIGCLLWGLEHVTAVEASSLSALEPLVSAVIAVTAMGVSLRWGHVAGGALVILAVLLLARQSVDSP